MPFLETDPQDRNANPDPLRTLKAVSSEDGTVHFTVDFQAPGSFQGIFVPATAHGPSGVVAYVYPVVAADLNEEVEPVTCLDTYDMETGHDTPDDLARALEAGVALVQALVDARLAGTSMVDASLALEDWAVAAADLLPDEPDTDEDATPPATETVFRDGFAAGWGAKASERIYSEEQEADEAWQDSGLT